MNFKFKTILAAVVLATSASAANAGIDQVISTAGSSELVFSAWDGSVGYTYDLLSLLNSTSFIGNDTTATQNTTPEVLAINNATLLSRAVVAPSLITGPNGLILDVALTGLPFSSTSAVEWNLTAVDGVGRSRVLLTADNSITPVARSNGQIDGVGSSLNTYYSAANGLIADPSQAGPAADVFVTSVTSDIAYAGASGNSFQGRTFDTTNTLGSSSFLYFLAETSSNADLGNSTSLFKQMATATGENLVVSTYLQGNQWRLNLSVAAVPEPETYAMFLAGLGMMGAVARRRKNQVK